MGVEAAGQRIFASAAIKTRIVTPSYKIRPYIYCGDKLWSGVGSTLKYLQIETKQICWKSQNPWVA